MFGGLLDVVRAIPVLVADITFGFFLTRIALAAVAVAVYGVRGAKEVDACGALAAVTGAAYVKGAAEAGTALAVATYPEEAPAAVTDAAYVKGAAGAGTALAVATYPEEAPAAKLSMGAGTYEKMSVPRLECRVLIRLQKVILVEILMIQQISVKIK